VSGGRGLDDVSSSQVTEEIRFAKTPHVERDRPRQARAALAALEREQFTPSRVLAEEERVKLELLLAELLQLKSRLHGARASG
jgi:hypothetical protein